MFLVWRRRDAASHLGSRPNDCFQCNICRRSERWPRFRPAAHLLPIHEKWDAPEPKHAFDNPPIRHKMSDTSISIFWNTVAMANQSLMICLNPELKAWLETEAKRQGRSAACIAEQAVQSLKDRSEAKAQLIREAVAEADKGIFISEDRMNDWMDSWDSEGELPSPKPDVFPIHT